MEATPPTLIKNQYMLHYRTVTIWNSILGSLFLCQELKNVQQSFTARDSSGHGRKKMKSVIICVLLCESISSDCTITLIACTKRKVCADPLWARCI